METPENTLPIYRLCSNIGDSVSGEASPCTKCATGACVNCGLVQYCGKECQAAHWISHKSECKSSLLKANWKPGWDVEQRMPAFIGDGPSQSLFGVQKYMWGNVPAFDVLNLVGNECSKTERDYAFLFAASGDIRNVVKTVNGLPASFSRTCAVIINDLELDLVARNAILLLVAFHYEPELAAPMMIHLWYSALIPSQMYQRLRKDILPLVTDVCTKIKEKPLSSLQSKTWTFRSGSLRLVLQAMQWFKLRQYFEIPVGLSAATASKVRTEVTLAPSRKDYLERALFNQPPSWRMCIMRFRGDGILLPYGSYRGDFDTPNPTIFRTAHTWPLMDSADPLDGWNLDDIIKHAPLAKHDKYGSLFVLLQKTLLQFSRNLHNFDIHVQLFHMNAVYLPQVLKPTERFDRIEVSNIADRGYLGPELALKTVGHLLKSKEENSHAAVVALFINVTHEEKSPADQITSFRTNLNSHVAKYLPLPSPRDLKITSAFLGRLLTATSLFEDNDTLFQQFLSTVDMTGIARAAGLRMRSRQSIIEPWPLKLQGGATQQQFDILLASGHNGSERYTEFERV